MPGSHGYFSHAGLLLFMCIHSGNPCYVQGNIYLFILFIGEDMCFVFLHAGSSMAAQLGAGEFVGANAEVQLSQRQKMPLFSLSFCSSLALADDSFQSTFLSVAAPVVTAFLSRCPHQRNLFYSDTPFPIRGLEEVLRMVLGWCG